MMISQSLTSASAIAATNCFAVLGFVVMPAAAVSQTTTETTLESAFACFPTDGGENPFVFGFVQIDEKTYLQVDEDTLPVDVKYQGDRWFSFKGDGFLGSRDRRNVLTFLNEAGQLNTMQCVEITQQARFLATDFSRVSELEQEVSHLREELNAANERVAFLGSELEALSGNPPTDEASPLQLMESTAENFLRAIARCWNVDVGAEWTGVKITVEFDLDEAGKLDGSIRLINFTGGTERQAYQAFGSARRAILRCSVGGFALPADQYERWKTMQVTFDPTTMRVE